MSCSRLSDGTFIIFKTMANFFVFRTLLFVVENTFQTQEGVRKNYGMLSQSKATIEQENR